jgi:hypothetical protein
MVHNDEAVERLGNVHSTLQVRTITQDVRAPVSGADVKVNVFMPGFQGYTIQTFEDETNGFGYVSFAVLPNAAYNFTATKDGFLDSSGVGASGAPGEKQGEDVRMSPMEGFQKALEKIASPNFLLFSLSALLVLVLVVKRKSLARRFKGGRRRR